MRRVSFAFVRYEHVIWDWNGTLFDDTPLCVEIMGGMLAKRGLAPLDEGRYREVFTFPVRDYYARLGFDFGRESFADLAVEFHDSTGNNLAWKGPGIDLAPFGSWVVPSRTARIRTWSRMPVASSPYLVINDGGGLVTPAGQPKVTHYFG